jgi:hypothetical protein
MVGLNLLRKARILVLLLLSTACAPLLAPSSTVDHAVERVYVADMAGDERGNDTSPLEAGQARIRATQVTIPTYPLESYRAAAFDPVYRWPYFRFDRERFQVDAPATQSRRYDLLVLENDYLEVSILPELGGRIWQVTHKPTGDTMFYQNRVVKPSPWGLANQLGWLGLGGLEWALPVNEHGYDWGTPWEVTTFQGQDGSAGARIATPRDGRLLAAEIVVTLHPERAYVTVAPTIRNLADHALDFHFWQTAMLAPGPGNQLSADLRFILPNHLMAIHSTGDTLLPGPGGRFTWPSYFGRDLSRLGNWNRYVGFFEYPTAQGPFVGVYDSTLDAGAVRVFPAEIAQGSKVFGLGWRNAILSEDFTDDGSAYVELHGGLSPTFDEPYTLAGGKSVRWEESWYPVEGIGNFVYANLDAALNLARTAKGLQVAVYPTAPLTGTLNVLVENEVVARLPLTAAPDNPFRHDLNTLAPGAEVTLQLVNAAGELLLEYSSHDDQ